MQYNLVMLLLHIIAVLMIGIMLGEIFVSEVFKTYDRYNTRIRPSMSIILIVFIMVIIPATIATGAKFYAYQPPEPPPPNRVIILAFEDGPSDRDIRIVNKLVEATGARVLLTESAPFPSKLKATVRVISDDYLSSLQDEITRWFIRSKNVDISWDSALVLGDKHVGVFCQLQIRGPYSALQIPEMIFRLTTDLNDYMVIKPKTPRMRYPFEGL